MRAHPGRKSVSGKLRGRVERLDCLPIRAVTARQVMNALPSEVVDGSPLAFDWSKNRVVRELDPGWTLAERSLAGCFNPIEVVAERSWWPAAACDQPDKMPHRD